MIFAKTTPYGLESSVKNLQEHLDAYLPNYWAGTLHIYGLVFKNTNTDNEIIPEAYVGTGISKTEYRQVFNDDKVAGTIGFILQDRELEPLKKASLDVVFTLRLDKIYPLSTTREHEVALIHAERALNEYGIELIKDVKEGIRDVFSGFNTDRIIYNDMHPYSVFSFNIDLSYIDNYNCEELSVN